MQIMKKMLAAALCGALALSMAGCGGQAASQNSVSQSAASQPAPSQPGPVTFTDALGRTVTVEHPARVAAAQGSFAEAWLLAGGTCAAVTEDAFSERQLELPADVTVLGGTKEPSVEKAIEAGVDFMLLSSKVTEHVKLEDTLTKAGITCAYFEVETFEDYLSMLKTLTHITGRPDLYEQNGAAVARQVGAAIARSEGKQAPSVLLLRAYSTGVKAKGSDNMTGAMLADLGCRNIADSDTSLLEELSVEKIIQENPDYIFVVTMGESAEAALASVDTLLTSNPAWNGLSAVKNNRYHVLPKDLFHYKPNARWGESYEMLADILYPAN